MPIDLLALSAAAVAGLFGGGHCAAMCGGIATGIGATNSDGWRGAVIANLGRVLGYALGGALAGGIGAAVVGIVRIDGLALGLRVLAGGVLVIIALRMLDLRGRLRLLNVPGTALWQRLRPLQRRLVPANTWSKRLALGMLWGWLPCGLSTTLLTIAALQASATQGALTMTAFGLGTLPILVPLTWSGARLGRTLQRPAWRRAAASVVLLSGLVTLSVPWLMQTPQVHRLLSALGCIGPA